MTAGFTILSIIKRAKFHVCIPISTKVIFLTVLFIFQLTHTASCTTRVSQLRNKWHTQISQSANDDDREMEVGSFDGRRDDKGLINRCWFRGDSQKPAMLDASLFGTMSLDRLCRQLVYLHIRCAHKQIMCEGRCIK